MFAPAFLLLHIFNDNFTVVKNVFLSLKNSISYFGCRCNGKQDIRPKGTVKNACRAPGFMPQ
ncbi:hypothetical protein DPQ25_04190 [Hydrogeniiclostridium mannosilyticum]|uniref:Uncharacterized protein n=1 Tax=Hydrogeniiclostridium mannosilyticum TaxID=2764322 RepID=A0A328UKH1_9FIRM|nr:hypothetical protein DPQ25_04190 [Hydrogeniiclostridium mannosilyticum]